MRFTATVKKKSVVVRGVDLPDGVTVDVAINERTYVPTEEEDRMVAESRRQFARGEYYDLEDVLAELRGGPKAVLVRDQRRRKRKATARSSGVGKPASRAKSPAVRSELQR